MAQNPQKQPDYSRRRRSSTPPSDFMPSRSKEGSTSGDDLNIKQARAEHQLRKAEREKTAQEHSQESIQRSRRREDAQFTRSTTPSHTKEEAQKMGIDALREQEKKEIKEELAKTRQELEAAHEEALTASGAKGTPTEPVPKDQLGMQDSTPEPTGNYENPEGESPEAGPRQEAA